MSWLKPSEPTFQASFRQRLSSTWEYWSRDDAYERLVVVISMERDEYSKRLALALRAAELRSKANAAGCGEADVKQEISEFRKQSFTPSKSSMA